MRKLWLVLYLLFFCCSGAWAEELRKEMLRVMDTICKGGPAAEAVIDWEHLNIVSPSLAGKDLQEYYRSMNDAQKAAFRRGLVSTFSRSFLARFKGSTYSDAAKIPGILSFRTKGARPALTAKGKSSKLTVEFSRVDGKLKMAKMLI